MVENDLYGMFLDSILDLEIAIGLCTARMGAILADALGRARARDLRANIFRGIEVVCLRQES